MANIRTIDYKGSDSASAGTGPKGWMFWSGSTTVSNQTYSGLGLELMDTSESYLKFTTADGGDLDLRAKKFYVGTPTSQFISGSSGAIEISSSNFHLTGGNVIMAGDITANTGNIGGWHIASTALTASNIILSSSGTIQTSDFQSSLLGTGKGWKIGSDGVAEFEEARIRGTLSTAVFEKDTISAVGGQVIIANATTTTGSEVLYPGVAAQTINVANAGGFVNGEWLIAKATASAGFTTEMMLVSSVNSSSTPNTITLVRNANSSTSIPTMSSGQVLVSQGASGSGYIYMNADPTDSATPYIDIVERTGSAIGDTKIKARLGDLSGLAGVGPVPADPGFGLYSENVFLSGTITASAGEIGGWGIGATKLSTGGFEIAASGSNDYAISSSGFTVRHNGLVAASNFAEKFVIVGETNSGSYFSNNGGDGVNLIFDGSGGGEVTMNMQLNVAPRLANGTIKPIQDIILPLEATGVKMEATVIINVAGVEFDEGTIAASSAGVTW